MSSSTRVCTDPDEFSCRLCGYVLPLWKPGVCVYCAVYPPPPFPTTRIKPPGKWVPEEK